MKCNKNLNPFEDKKLSSIDLVFENCEVYNIPAENIYKMSIDEIEYSFSVHINGLSKYTKPGEITSFASTEFVWIALTKDGMNINSGWSDMFPDSELLKDRIRYNDITHIDFIFDDGSNLYVGVPWEDGDTEFCNKLQKNDIRNDMLFITIGDSEYDIEELNDNNEKGYAWDNEDDMEIETSDNSEYNWIATPSYVQAAFRAIDDELYRVMWNLNQEEFESPFDNTANSFQNDVFEVEAYSWDDEYDQEYNFKWKDYKVRWYKHSRRDPQSNREMSAEECSKMLDECLESIRRMDLTDDDLFGFCDDTHQCLQCGKTTDDCKKLECDKWVCQECLDKLGQEQKQIKEELENSLFEFGFDNYEEVTDCIDTFLDILKYIELNFTSIQNIRHLINSIEAINTCLRLENGLLDDERIKEIQKFAENFNKK